MQLLDYSRRKSVLIGCGVLIVFVCVYVTHYCGFRREKRLENVSRENERVESGVRAHLKRTRMYICVLCLLMPSIHDRRCRPRSVYNVLLTDRRNRFTYYKYINIYLQYTRFIIMCVCEFKSRTREKSVVPGREPREGEGERERER